MKPILDHTTKVLARGITVSYTRCYAPRSLAYRLAEGRISASLRELPTGDYTSHAYDKQIDIGKGVKSKVLRVNEFCQGNDLYLMKQRRSTSKSFLGNWRNREGYHGPRNLCQCLVIAFTSRASRHLCFFFYLLLPSHFPHPYKMSTSPKWTFFCGMSGNPHDTNAIECPSCGALNPRATTGSVLPSKYCARSLRKEVFELFSPLPQRILPILKSSRRGDGGENQGVNVYKCQPLKHIATIAPSICPTEIPVSTTPHLF